jgi:hypothetical protein
MEACALEPQVFLYGARRVLALLHMAGSVVLLGACTHHALLMRHYLRGRLERAPLEKTYAKVLCVAYAATFAIGALLYPTYRVHVRGYHLDRFAPAYARFFDVKETFASLALFVVLGLGALAYAWRPREEPHLAKVVAGMSFVVCAVVWLNAIVGVLVVSVRGVG